MCPDGRPIDTTILESAPRRRGAWSPWWCALLLALHFVLRIVFDPWLNASSDRKFWTALAIVATPFAFAVFALYRAIRPKPFH